MQAQTMMSAKPVTVLDTDTVGTVLARMEETGLPLLPVLDGKGAVAGVVTRFSIMTHIVPSYIATGDLDDVAYAPDIGLLRRHYDALLGKPVAEVLDAEPLLVRPDSSLLSVAATLITHGKHESALVVDEHKRLLGIISVGDVLAGLKTLPGGAPDA
jgi:CBS domain-containing protein